MMSPEDQKLIAAFVKDKPMYEAVRRVLLSGMIGENFERTNWVWNIDRNLSDTAYGKEVKLYRRALEWIVGGFEEMLKYGQSNPQPSTLNEAR